jgi:hypothetical protein
MNKRKILTREWGKIGMELLMKIGTGMKSDKVMKKFNENYLLDKIF